MPSVTCIVMIYCTEVLRTVFFRLLILSIILIVSCFDCMRLFVPHPSFVLISVFSSYHFQFLVPRIPFSGVRVFGVFSVNPHTSLVYFWGGKFFCLIIWSVLNCYLSVLLLLCMFLCPIIAHEPLLFFGGT